MKVMYMIITTMVYQIFDSLAIAEPLPKHCVHDKDMILETPAAIEYSTCEHKKDVDCISVPRRKMVERIRCHENNYEQC